VTSSSAASQTTTRIVVRIRSSTDTAHDALHHAFLAYRQYRALREAWVLSLLLPPEVPLPAPLHRYEEREGSLYSVRDLAHLVLHHFDGDVEAALDFLVDATPPMPADAWRSPYDPFTALFEAWNEFVPDLVAKHGSTDDALAEHRQKAAAAHHARVVAAWTAAAEFELVADAAVPGR
jgi:hypothetical protein